MGLTRFELVTSRLSGVRSNRLSYRPSKKGKREARVWTGSRLPHQGTKLSEQTLPFTVKGGDPAALSSTATLLRLHPPYQAYLRHRPPLLVRQATSGTPNSGGVTGGVYKARERIHRAMLMRDY